jgi:hypothetical protein
MQCMKGEADNILFYSHRAYCYNQHINQQINLKTYNTWQVSTCYSYGMGVGWWVGVPSSRNTLDERNKTQHANVCIASPTLEWLKYYFLTYLVT